MERGVLGYVGAPAFATAIRAAAAVHALECCDTQAGLVLYAGSGLRRSMTASAGMFLGDRFTGEGGDWGNYLAFETRPDGATIVRRAAITGMPLYWTSLGDGLLFFSHLELVHRLDLPMEIDFEFVRYLLAYSNRRTARTGVAGIHELLPGTEVVCHRGAPRVETRWSPWAFARNSIGNDEAAAKLEEAILGATSAWAADRAGIIVELSGGLDSSIVAAALKAGHHEFGAATIATVSPDGDERHFARAVAERCGAPLAETIHAALDLDLLGGPRFIAPRPATYGVLAGIDAALGSATSSEAAASVFTGIGGDNVFAINRSITPAVDAISVLGPSLRSMRALRDCAELCGATIWRATRATYRQWRRVRDVNWPRDDDYTIVSELPTAPLPHPWDADTDDVPVGKVRHVQSIHRITDFLDRPGRWHGRDVVAPLLSQPIVELCLAIPSWEWTAGGRDRAVARTAFADHLPASVVWRRAKGRLETMCAEAFLSQRMRLRPVLLEGNLAHYGLIDRQRIEAYLDRERIEGDYDYFRLMELVDIELWIASVAGVGRGNARAPQRRY